MALEGSLEGCQGFLECTLVSTKQSMLLSTILWPEKVCFCPPYPGKTEYAIVYHTLARQSILLSPILWSEIYTLARLIMVLFNLPWPDRVSYCPPYTGQTEYAIVHHTVSTIQCPPDRVCFCPPYPFLDQRYMPTPHKRVYLIE